MIAKADFPLTIVGNRRRPTVFSLQIRAKLNNHGAAVPLRRVLRELGHLRKASLAEPEQGVLRVKCADSSV